MSTLADLAKVSDKAELICGRIMRLMPAGFRPSRPTARIWRSLYDFATATGDGFAFTSKDQRQNKLPNWRASRRKPDVIFGIHVGLTPRRSPEESAS